MRDVVTSHRCRTICDIQMAYLFFWHVFPWGFFGFFPGRKVHRELAAVFARLPTVGAASVQISSRTDAGVRPKKQIRAFRLHWVDVYFVVNCIQARSYFMQVNATKRTPRYIAISGMCISGADSSVKNRRK